MVKVGPIIECLVFKQTEDKKMERKSKHTERLTDVPMSRHTKRWMGEERDRQKDGQMDGWSDIKDRQRETDIWMDEQTYRKTEKKERDRQKDVQMDGRRDIKDRHMDG